MTEPQSDHLARAVPDAAAELASSHEAEAMQWRPIETAPKDGAWIAGAEWQTPPGYGPELNMASTRFFNGAWRYQSGNDWTPTHWMPLPADPAGAACKSAAGATPSNNPESMHIPTDVHTKPGKGEHVDGVDTSGKGTSK